MSVAVEIVVKHGECLLEAQSCQNMTEEAPIEVLMTSMAFPLDTRLSSNNYVGMRLASLENC